MDSIRRIARSGKPLLALAAIAAFVLGLSATSATAAPDRPALAYWAFNCFTTCGDANFQPEAVGLSTASMTSSFAPDAGVNQSGTPLNSIPPYEARSALTLRSGTGGINNGRNLTWSVNTTGYTFLSVSFAARRSVAGFNSCQFQYSLDGSSFVDFGAPFDPASTFAVVAFDLRHVKGLNNNPQAGFRIVFNGGSTTDANEFALIDNLQVTGK